MDIYQLYQLLSGLLKVNSPNTPVILARDAEGNNFSPLSSWSAGKYEPETGYSGRLLSDDEESDGSYKAIVLWPGN